MFYLMICLAIFVALLFLISVRLKKYDYKAWQNTAYDWVEPLPYIFSVLLFIMPIGIYGCYTSELKVIREIEATRDTIETCRTSKTSDIERAALIQVIIRKNEKIAELRRDSHHWFWKQTTPIEAYNLRFLK